MLNQQIAELQGKLSITEQEAVGLTEQPRSQRVSFRENPAEEVRPALQVASHTFQTLKSLNCLS